MIAHFVHLKESELKVLLPDLTLVIFPVGGLEQHGPHLPLGTKLIQSREWVNRLAQKLESQFKDWNFLIMPELPFTVDTYTSATALRVRPHVMRDALVDQCASLRKMGFHQFAAFSSHFSPKQLSAIEDASKIVDRWKKCSLVSLSSALIDSPLVLQSPAIALPQEHAGAFDTGWMLSVNPNLVASQSQSLVAVAAPQATISRYVEYVRGKLDGYWGNPADANPVHAKAKIESDLDRIIEKLKPVLLQGKGKRSFHSGYRWYPMNGSFFKAYILATVFFISMLFWFLMGVKNAVE
jgi:creatinine amidohydrolase